MPFHISGIEVAVWIPPLVAAVISFFTSMAGVSGAFLLLPFQVSFLGYTAPSVSATNQLFNIVAIPGGVYRYYKEGRMVWPLAWVMVAGSLPGVFIGAILRIVYLPDPRTFKLFAAGVLFYVGFKLVLDLVKKDSRNADTINSGKGFREMMSGHRPKTGAQELSANVSLSSVKVIHFNFKRLVYTFYGESFDIPFWGVFILSLIVGIAGGIYGIGGGSIIAPLFVTFFGLPVYTVAGAVLMGTFVTSIAGVVSYKAIAPLYPDISVEPDWLLGILFGLGGMVGMYLGARCQRFMPARAINWMLSVIIIFTAFSYITQFLKY